MGIRGRQRFRPFGDVEHDGARFKQPEPFRLDRRNLAERLQGAIVGLDGFAYAFELLASGDACKIIMRPETAAVEAAA